MNNSDSDSKLPELSKNNPNRKLAVGSFLADPSAFLEQQTPTDRELKRLFGIACGKQNLGLALQLLNYWINSDSSTTGGHRISDLDLNIKNMILHLICENGHLSAETDLKEALLESSADAETKKVFLGQDLAFWQLKIQDLVTQILSGPIGDEKLFTLGIRFYCSVGSYEEGKVLFGTLMNSGEKPHIRTFLPLLEASPDLEQIQGWHRLAREHSTKSPNQEFYECFFRRLLQLAPAAQKNKLFLEAFNVFRSYHMYVSPPLLKVLKDGWSLNNIDVRPDGRIIDDCGQFCGCLKSEDIPDNVRQEFVDGLYKKHQARFQGFDNVMQKRGFVWDIVFDGANIALYNNSEFRPDRIYRLARWAMKRNWKVLLILHTKRRHKSIEQFVKEYSSQIQIFYTPIGFNDDHYWIYAALSRNCYIVSNDEMRDHIFQNFNDEAFRVWKERHRITYHFDRERKGGEGNGVSGQGRGGDRGGSGGSGGSGQARGGRGARGQARGGSGARGQGRGQGRGQARGQSGNWKVFLPPPYSRTIQIHREKVEEVELVKVLRRIYLPIYDPEKWGDDYLQNLSQILGWCELKTELSDEDEE